MAKKSAASLAVGYAQDLEYCYRDAFKAFVGEGEVLLEFANINRSNPSEVTVADRIVLSLPNAVRLLQHLQAEMKEAKERFEEKHGEVAAS